MLKQLKNMILDAHGDQDGQGDHCVRDVGSSDGRRRRNLGRSDDDKFRA